MKRQLAYSRDLAVESLPNLIKVQERLDATGLTEHGRVHNVLTFSVLYDFERACSMEDVIDHQYKLRGTVYARLLVLLIYETSQKLRHLLGGQFQSDLRTLGYSEAEIGDARAIHKCFVETFERCNEEFGDVRDGAVGHRDAASATQIDLIRKADVRSVVDLSLDMGACMVRLKRLLVLHSGRLLAELSSELADKLKRE